MAEVEESPILVLEKLATKRGVSAPVYELLPVPRKKNKSHKRKRKFLYQVTAFDVVATGKASAEETAKEYAAKSALQQLEKKGIYNPNAPAEESAPEKPATLNTSNNIQVLHEFCEQRNIPPPHFVTATSSRELTPEQRIIYDCSILPSLKSTPYCSLTKDYNIIFKLIMEKRGLTLNDLKDYMSDEYTEENFDIILKKLGLTKDFFSLGDTIVLSFPNFPIVPFSTMAENTNEAEAKYEASKVAYKKMLKWITTPIL